MLRRERKRRWFSTEEASWQTLITPMFCVVDGCSARSIQPRETEKSLFTECPRLLLTKRGEKAKSWLENSGKELLYILRLQIEGAELDHFCAATALPKVTSCLWFHLCNISLQQTVPSLVCFFALSFHLKDQTTIQVFMERNKSDQSCLLISTLNFLFNHYWAFTEIENLFCEWVPAKTGSSA